MEYYKWSKEDDFFGDQYSYAYIRNVHFFEEEGDIFSLPDGAGNVE